MNDKEALEILIGLLNKPYLSDREKEAVSNAIGIFSWSSLSEGHIKSLKASREKKRSDATK